MLSERLPRWVSCCAVTTQETKHAWRHASAWRRWFAGPASLRLPWPLRYLSAFALSAVALAMRSRAGELLPLELTGLFAAVLISGVWLGVGPGALCILLCSAGLAYFEFEPAGFGVSEQ